MFFLDSKLKEQVPPPRPDLDLKKRREKTRKSRGQHPSPQVGRCVWWVGVEVGSPSVHPDSLDLDRPFLDGLPEQALHRTPEARGVVLVPGCVDHVPRLVRGPVDEATHDVVARKVLQQAPAVALLNALRLRFLEVQELDRGELVLGSVRLDERPEGLEQVGSELCALRGRERDREYESVR